MMLRVGTDCSGIESPIQALDNLGISYSHEFSSDICIHVVKSIRANYDPKIIFNDILRRDISTVPDIDLYVAGFPCQSFSSAGDRKGFGDKRGTVFWGCYEVIISKQPKYFILENVKGLLSHDNGKSFKTILSLLESLENYDIYHNVLNTRNYGTPQNRERVFIIGILKSLNKEFTWPEYKDMNNLIDYIDYSNQTKGTAHKTKDLLASGLMDRIPKDSLFIDISFRKGNYPNSGRFCPTITRNCRIWNVKMERYANIPELLSLQGFPKNFKQVVSDTQMKRQIGNSMSVNVITEILRSLLS